MVAPVLNQGDVRDAHGIDPSVPARVASDCAGSAASWAQAYLYAVTKMGGRGVALGSDANGFNRLPSPRFGPNAAYDLDNGVVPDERRRPLRAAQVAAQHNGVRYDSQARDWRRYRWAEGATAEQLYSDRERDIWVAVGVVRSGCDPWSDRTPAGGPIEGISERVRNLAKGLTAATDEQLLRPSPFFGIGTGDAPWEQRAGFLVRTGQVPGSGDRDPPPVHEIYAELRPIWERAQAMDGANIPINRSQAGRRDFDINVDGMAHYGMLPDFLHDLRNLGLSDDDLAPLFRSAEEYIELWERCERRQPTAGENAFRVVEVDATAFAHLFWGADSVVVEDSIETFSLKGAASAATIQTRTYPPGTTAATEGLQVYEYRVALSGVPGDAAITSMAVEAGELETVEYTPGTRGEVFVVTTGGVGSVSIDAVERAGTVLTFHFAGGGIESGASSLFFGMTAAKPPRAGITSLVDTAGNTYETAVRVPG